MRIGGEASECARTDTARVLRAALLFRSTMALRVACGSRGGQWSSPDGGRLFKLGHRRAVASSSATTFAAAAARASQKTGPVRPDPGLGGAPPPLATPPSSNDRSTHNNNTASRNAGPTCDTEAVRLARRPVNLKTRAAPMRSRQGSPVVRDASITARFAIALAPLCPCATNRAETARCGAEISYFSSATAIRRHKWGFTRIRPKPAGSDCRNGTW
ncbi:hypothetical protein MTO96_002653 [Rhipicephalus appendiculatus]